MSLSNALRFASLSASALLLGGCAFAPSIPLLGAAFPDWLFCIVGGVAVTVLVHAVLGRRGALSSFAPLAISYPALCAVVAMALWLMFFSH